MTHCRLCWWPTFRHDMYFLFESPVGWEVDYALVVMGVQVNI